MMNKGYRGRERRSMERTGLPGGDLIREGIEDLAAGRERG
jgi:hypothetical protein